MFRYQVELFFLALSFFSRLPVPADTPYSSERMNQAGRYFALVGVLLGGLTAFSYILFSQWFPAQVSLVLMMTFSLMLTGAFHEDGLTDMADGIGGSMNGERRLAIMKDSRIGTYGACTLIMALLAKFVFLSALVADGWVVAALVVSYSLSRAVAASLIYDMPYVSDPDTSKSKPLANRQKKGELLFSLLCGILPCLWFGLKMTLVLCMVAVIFRWLFRRWLMARIGGFTGDCLGAAQQLMELLAYLVLIASLPVV